MTRFSSRRNILTYLRTSVLLGVTAIGVYLTPRTHPDTRGTLTQYGATPLVQLRTIDYLEGGSGTGHLLMVNLAAINDCLYRHMYTHRFVAVIDFDEVNFVFRLQTGYLKVLTFNQLLHLSYLVVPCKVI